MSVRDNNGFPEKRRGSSLRRHGSTAADEPYDEFNSYDTMNIPDSVLQRRASGPMPNLVGSSVDCVYLIPSNIHFSARKWLLGPVIFMYFAAYITAYLAFPQYVYDRVKETRFPNIGDFNDSSVCEVNKSDPEYQNKEAIQKEAAQWTSNFSLAGILAIFANIILGSVTDRYGRKFLLLLAIFGSFIKVVVFTIGIYLKMNLWLFLIGYIVEACTGQLFTVLLVSFAYIADITPPKGKKRSFGITLVELSIGIALAVSSFASGYIIDSVGFDMTMVGSCGLFVLTFLLALLLPESFRKDKRDPTSSIFQNLKTAFHLFFGSFNEGRRWMYNVLMMVFTLTVFTVFGRSSVEPPYQLGPPFCWTPLKLGYYSAARSTAQQALGMGMVKVFQMFMSDEAIAMMGCVSFVASYIIEGLAKTDIMFYIASAVGAVGLLTVPMTRALLSKLTRADQQGAVFAAIATMETTMNLGGTLAAIAIYQATIDIYPGIVFFVMAGFSGISFILMAIFQFGSKRTLPRPLEIRR